MKVKELEIIFNNVCKENMINWDLEEFKNTHRNLYNCVILSMHESLKINTQTK